MSLVSLSTAAFTEVNNVDDPAERREQFALEFMALGEAYRGR